MSAVPEAQEPSARYLDAVQPTLMRQFELLGTAPGGMSRLRELILTLAVQGRLVAQDQSDEPASLLLRRIEGERERLVAAGQIRQPRAASLLAEEEQPYAAPAGWVWARLDQLSPFGLSDGDWIETKDQDPEGEVRLIQLADIGDGHFKDKSSRFVSTATCTALNCTLLRPADVLIARLPSPIGRACVFPGVGQEAITAVDVAICRLGSGLVPAFVALAINAPQARLLIESYGKGATRFRVSTGHLKTLPIAVPPVGEQVRIAARVDELMRLCDALEAKGRLEAEQHARLLGTLLGTLTDSSTPEELATNWRRVADNFDLLLDRPEAVDALEQTVLQLAVRGLLTRQNSQDEPASALVERLRSKRGAPKSLLAADEIPHTLPPSWAWVRFDELIDPARPISYGVLVPGPDVPGGVPFVRIADLSLTHPPTLPEKRISVEVDAQYSRTRLVGGEILMGVVGSIGKLGVAPASWVGANIARAICRIVPAEDVCRAFVLLLLQSKFMQMSFAGETRTLAQPTLNVGLIRASPAPVPPLAEQIRIVARVTELRRFCADLRQRLVACQTTQSHLADALIESAIT